MATWYVVADAAKARIFQQKSPRDTAEEIHTLVHPAARAPGSSLTSDAPGAQANAGSGTHGMQEKVTPRQAEDQRFAREVIDQVRHALNDNQISQFYMAAPPHFLGLLRGAMDNRVSKALAGDLDKNLSTAKPDEACAAFKPKLM
ncbi:host attachment protein [Marinobacterium sediminicola]|uniref:Protein required for attachment to host cells n=1 Tax=Marinobacterium sediminicola TaxID=518898 RepID=A0ABY1S0Z6_9GAMM|nr:host attachment protein [Marinobacterium sediminicola]ULG69833.1 host attachment protein [Marinobacterium sediminicola]SMR75352.1 Protein required for attachment to host cells [Marinobacterium sediminicola]